MTTPRCGECLHWRLEQAECSNPNLLGRVFVGDKSMPTQSPRFCCGPDFFCPFFEAQPELTGRTPTTLLRWKRDAQGLLQLQQLWVSITQPGPDRWITVPQASPDDSDDYSPRPVIKQPTPGW